MSYSNIVIVRHGQSEANEIQHTLRNGDINTHPKALDFIETHTSNVRLTEEGVRQAQKAGRYVRETLQILFYRCFVSPYVRTYETAIGLCLGNSWEPAIELAERNWHDLDHTFDTQRKRVCTEKLKESRMFAGGPQIETMASVCARIGMFLQSLPHGANIIIVCHAEVMRAFEYHPLNLTPESFESRWKTPIFNAEIHHYKIASRKDTPKRRIIRPTNDPISITEWETAEKRAYSEDDLRALAYKHPRLFT